MNIFCPVFRFGVFFIAFISFTAAQTPQTEPSLTGAAQSSPAAKTYPPDRVQSGAALFRQDCSFCHGRDATGGESGPDLTRSKLVRADVDGDKIARVILNGRPEKGMPPFEHSDDQIASLVAFIHTQQNNAHAAGGGRRGVDVADLQTGNAEAGKQYFNGAGGCSNCHSPTGDLAGVASRYQGLELEQQMLFPKNAKSKVTVTPATGGTPISGTLAYQDEFTIALVDSAGNYHSWRTRDVQFKVDSPMDAHAKQFPKYADADVHNLMAYLQTLR